MTPTRGLPGLLGRVVRPLVSRSAVLTAALVDHPVAKHRSRHHLLRRLAARWGLPIYEEYVTWFEDPEVTRVWSAYPESDAPLLDRHFHLYQLAKATKAVPGDTVECGVYRGRGSWFILSAGDKSHHIFDSFEGLSEPEAADRPSDPRAFAWRKHTLTMSADVVRKNLAAFTGRFEIYPGWIPERFPAIADRRFAFVHLDVDLYAPTRDSLAFFYPRTSPGGVIVCDDFGFSTCPGAKRAVLEFMADKPEPVIPLSTGQSVIFRAG